MLFQMSRHLHESVQLFILLFEMVFISFSCCLSRFSYRRSIHVRQRGFARPEFFLLRDGAIALRDSLALLPWHVRETSVPRTLVSFTSVIMHPRQREGEES